MSKRIIEYFVFILAILLFAVCIPAVPFYPQGNIDMQDDWGLINALDFNGTGDFNWIGWIEADGFTGDGSGLINISSTPDINGEDVNLNDLNVRDINAFGILAHIVYSTFIGDGSGITNVSSTADVNGEDVRLNNVEIDANLGVQGDANFHQALMSNAYFGAWFGDVLSPAYYTDTNADSACTTYSQFLGGTGVCIDLNTNRYLATDINAHFAPIFSPTFTGDANFANIGMSGGFAGLNAIGDSNFSRLQATNIYVDSNVYALDANLGGVKIPQVHTVTTEPTGFVNRTSSTLGFVDATRVFTITGVNFPVYVNGVEYLKNTESITVDDATGMHWIYYAANGALSQAATIPSFSLPLIATIYYNTDAGFDKGSLGEERHGIKMDGDTHALLHYTVGTRYESGLVGTFGNTTFSMTSGKIDDEDISHSIGAETTCKVFYKDGAADFVWTTEQAEYYHEVGGVLQYNNGNVLTNVTPASHVAYWVFATNDTTTPIYSLMGQRQDVTLANARLNNTYESLTLGTLPFEEMKLLYRVILKNVGGTTTYVETQDLRSVSNLPAGTYVATAHNVLTGLNWSQAGHTFDVDLNLGAYGLKVFGDSNFHTLGIGNSLFVAQDINVGESITAPFFFGDGGGLSGIIATNITPDTTCDNNLDCQNWLFGLDLNTSLKADLNANFYGKLDVNENFVPYIGATNDVNLGTNALTAGLDSNIGSPTEFWQYTKKDFSGTLLPMLLPHSTIGNYGAIEGGLNIVEPNGIGSITVGLYDYATTGYWVFEHLTADKRLNIYNDTADSPLFITANTSNIGDFNATGDINAGSDVNVTGSVQATAFFGDGSGLTNVTASGGLPDSTIDTNGVADLNWLGNDHLFTGDNNFVNIGLSGSVFSDAGVYASSIYANTSVDDTCGFYTNGELEGSMRFACSAGGGEGAEFYMPLYTDDIMRVGLDLNVYRNSQIRGDLNVWEDVNVVGGISAKAFFGDGSGLQNVSASADVNGADINPANVLVDNNVIVYGAFEAAGDANVINLFSSGYLAIGSGIGMATSLGIGDLNVEDDIYTVDLHSRYITSTADFNGVNIGVSGRSFFQADVNVNADLNVTGSVTSKAFFGDGSGLSGVLTSNTVDTTCDTNLGCQNWLFGLSDQNFAVVTDFNKMYHSIFDLNTFYYKIVDVNTHFSPIFSPTFTGDANFVNVGISTTLYGDTSNGDLSIGSDVNISSGVNTGVGIESDANRLCFPSDSCEMYIDYNGTAFIFGG